LGLIIILFISVNAITNSKLSIHTGFSGSGSGSWSIVRTGHPRVIKLLDNFQPAVALKQAVPGIIIVGRIYLPDQPQSGDPLVAAQNWWNSVSSTILSNPDVDYWEGYNEPNPTDITWIVNMEIERVKILASHGKKASVFNFSVGNPDVTNSSTITALHPGLQAARDNGGILGLHEYSSPYMNSSYSGGPCDGSGWLTGRYRKLYGQLPSPLNSIPLVISETGIDCGTCGANGCKCNGGWKGACPLWPTSDCTGSYLEMLKWYDSVLRCDSYILGSTIFSLEIPNWDTFDIESLVPALGNYLASQ